MSDAVSAILEHYSQYPNHDKCLKGPNSLCSYNRDIATTKSRYRLWSFVTVIKLLFDKLGSERFLFLSSCENAKTQNLNESYHHLVWSLDPKEQQLSPLETKLSIETATLLFNLGYKTTFLDVYDGTLITEKLIKQWDNLDHDKEIRTSWQKRELSKLNRKKNKYKKAKQNDAFSHEEGILYKSGKFHSGEQ